MWVEVVDSGWDSIGMVVVLKKFKIIVYWYIDVDGVVYFYVQILDDLDKFMVSSVLLFNYFGSKEVVILVDLLFVWIMLVYCDVCKYDDLFIEVVGEFGLDVVLLKVVMMVEFGFNVMVVFSKGVVGLMQILFDIVECYGLQGDCCKMLYQKLIDLKINICLVVCYLCDLMVMFLQYVELVIVFYNVGEGVVQKYGNKILFYFEIQGYVWLVLWFYELYWFVGVLCLVVGECGNVNVSGNVCLKVMLFLCEFVIND